MGYAAVQVSYPTVHRVGEGLILGHLQFLWRVDHEGIAKLGRGLPRKVSGAGQLCSESDGAFVSIDLGEDGTRKKLESNGSNVCMVIKQQAPLGPPVQFVYMVFSYGIFHLKNIGCPGISYLRDVGFLASPPGPTAS